MRILLLHAERIWYETVKPAVRNPPDPPGSHSEENAVVAYVSVESGDDEMTVRAAASTIVSYASETVKAEAIVVYPYAHLSSRLERPRRAHKILVALEREIREKWEGRLHRAPFGWYKRFEIRVYGHPLAELSRTIPAGEPVYYSPEGPRSLDALEKPRIEAWRPRLSKLGAEKASLLGLDASKPSWMASLVYERLEAWAYRRAGLDWQGRVASEEPARRADIVRLYKKAISNGAGWTLDPTPPWRIMVVKGLDPIEALEELSPGISRWLGEARLCRGEGCIDAGLEGRLLYYETSGGDALPLAVEARDMLALGPAHTLALAAVDSQARRAESEDWVPRLPAWMHPVTVYLVPTPDAVEYARMVAAELARTGANVIVDLSTKSLGPRIRAAGKLWTPIVAAVGRREAATGTVTVRRRWQPGSQETLSLPSLLEEVRGLLHPVGPGIVRIVNPP